MLISRTTIAALDLAPAGHLPHLVDQAHEAALRAHATSSAAGTCTVHPETCTETDLGHYDHVNHQHSVTDKRGESLVDISFIQFSDEKLGASEPVVCIGGHGDEDYPAHEFHAASASVRQLMDTGDDLAEKVMIREGQGETALDRIDQKIEDELARLVALVAHRRRVAISLNPGRTPFTEPDEQQVSSAAFHVATAALKVSLEKAPDPRGMLRAMASYVDLSRDETSA